MKKDLHILYIGSLWPGSTSRHRMNALRHTGSRVHEFDITQYISGKHRLLNSIAHRFNIGPSVSRFNHDLEQLTQTLKQPIDIIWVDKGKWLKPTTLQILSDHFKAVTIHYTPDPQLVAQKSKDFERCIPLYDLMLTTKPYEVNHYQRLKANRIKLVNQSYDNSSLYPQTLTTAQQATFSSPVSFIGHSESHYKEMLSHVADANIGMKIWGPNWQKTSKDSSLYPCIAGSGVWGNDYGYALNAAKIGLCLLTKRWPETTTTRSFEIPGCGTFMLAERTEHHQELFDEGREAEFFSDKEELLEKINYYLKNDSARQKIAYAGYERCKKSGYDNNSLLERLLNEASKELLE